MVFTKELSAFEKLEFVEKMFNELGVAFSEVTIDSAFTIYREVVEVIKNNHTVSSNTEAMDYLDNKEEAEYSYCGACGGDASHCDGC
jgi:hypothetical protein